MALDWLKESSSYTLNKFKENLEKRIIIYNIDIARWIFKAQQKINVSRFTASGEWVRRFKMAHNIVPQNVTNFLQKNFLIKRLSSNRKQ